MVLLGLLEWIVVGLVIGFIAGKCIDLHGDDPRLGIFAATGGAVLAAALYSFLASEPVAGWHPWTLACAAFGAVAGAVVWHLVRSRYVSRDTYVARRSY